MNGKKLVELVVEKMNELNLPLVWPECAKWGGQDNDGSFYFYKGVKPGYDLAEWVCGEHTDVCWNSRLTGEELSEMASDHTLLLSEQVFDTYVENLNKTASVTESNNKTEFVGVEEKRSRILVIDQAIDDLKNERKQLIEEIREAGFEVIVPEVEQVEGDGSTWKDWQVGDIVKLINNCEYTSMKKDRIGVITNIDYSDGTNQNIKVDGQYWPNVDNLIRIKKKGQ